MCRLLPLFLRASRNKSLLITNIHKALFNKRFNINGSSVEYTTAMSSSKATMTEDGPDNEMSHPKDLSSEPSTVTESPHSLQPDVSIDRDVEEAASREAKGWKIYRVELKRIAAAIETASNITDEEGTEPQSPSGSVDTFQSIKLQFERGHWYMIPASACYTWKVCVAPKLSPNASS